jgi:hypothetical protein
MTGSKMVTTAPRSAVGPESFPYPDSDAFPGQ